MQINKDIYVKLILFVSCLILCTSCNKQSIKTHIPTQEQIHQFKMQNNRVIIDEKDINNLFTVILYENNKQFGYYVLYINSKGEFTSDEYFSLKGDNKSNEKISIAGQSSSEPFAVILFNDKDLLSNTSTIIIRSSNGTNGIFQMEERKRSGYIIPLEKNDRNKSEIVKVELLNKRGEIIYSQ
ncbi:hypothetical protein ACFFK0_04615 [Paenibacillus chartarius]|uniref:Lipoprotein n=1 Tax=Paenibacillus chartarius TaxID=747481 RepID=A0ABV6DGL8_9BACL